LVSDADEPGTTHNEGAPPQFKFAAGCGEPGVLLRVEGCVRSVSAAVAAAEARIAAETADAGILPSGRSRLLSHGRPTGRAVLLLHGYTESPAQFDQLAPVFYAHGYNVYAPRAPHHGTVDPGAHARLDAAALLDYAAGAMDVAAALGDEAGVVGVSGGGVLATWLARHRADAVRRLLVLSPFYAPGPAQVPRFAVGPMTVLYGRRLLPDHLSSAGYSYRAISQYLRIARTLSAGGARTGLLSAAVAFSALDAVIDQRAAVEVTGALAAANGIPLEVDRLPADLAVGHNVVTPAVLGDRGPELAQRYFALYEGSRS
jgi:pimeloyl-ACP methyl ester carboxylesterase